KAKESIQNDNAVILRVVSNIANCLHPELMRLRKPYGVEVVGDPFDAFSIQSTHHPLSPLIRLWMTSRMKKQVSNASAAAYVTQEALQRRYPCHGPSFSYSSVELTDEAFLSNPRHYESAEDFSFAYSDVELTDEAYLDKPRVFGAKSQWNIV